MLFLRTRAVAMAVPVGFRWPGHIKVPPECSLEKRYVVVLFALYIFQLILSNSMFLGCFSFASSLVCLSRTRIVWRQHNSDLRSVLSNPLASGIPPPPPSSPRPYSLSFLSGLIRLFHYIARLRCLTCLCSLLLRCQERG